jgi:hypothetical protein
MSNSQTQPQTHNDTKTKGNITEMSNSQNLNTFSTRRKLLEYIANKVSNKVINEFRDVDAGYMRIPNSATYTPDASNNLEINPFTPRNRNSSFGSGFAAGVATGVATTGGLYLASKTNTGNRIISAGRAARDSWRSTANAGAGVSPSPVVGGGAARTAATSVGAGVSPSPAVGAGVSPSPAVGAGVSPSTTLDDLKGRNIDWSKMKTYTAKAATPEARMVRSAFTPDGMRGEGLRSNTRILGYNSAGKPVGMNYTDRLGQSSPMKLTGQLIQSPVSDIRPPRMTSRVATFPSQATTKTYADIAAKATANTAATGVGAGAANTAATGVGGAANTAATGVGGAAKTAATGVGGLVSRVAGPLGAIMAGHQAINAFEKGNVWTGIGQAGLAALSLAPIPGVGAAAGLASYMLGSGDDPQKISGLGTPKSKNSSRYLIPSGSGGGGIDEDVNKYYHILKNMIQEEVVNPQNKGTMSKSEISRRDRTATKVKAKAIKGKDTEENARYRLATYITLQGRGKSESKVKSKSIKKKSKKKK